MQTRSKTLVLLSLLTLTTLWFCAGAALGADVTDYVSRWTFDNSGAIGADSGPGGNTGVGTNATYTAAGQMAGAVSFTGNGYVAVPYAASLNLSAPFTVSAWVKIANAANNYGIMGTRIGGDTTFDLKVNGSTIHGDFGNGSNWINTGVDIGSGDTGTNGQGGNLTIGKWYLITYAVDTTAFRLYIDGDLKKTIANGTGNVPLVMKSGQTLRIGEDSGSEYMNGTIDDARIYGRALSTAEVLSVHNAGIVIPPIAFLANPFTVTRATAGQPYVGSVAATTNDNVAGDAVFSKTSGPAWLSIAANGAVTGTPGAGDVGGPFPVGIHVVSTGNTTTANATMNIAVGDGLVTTKILFIQGKDSRDLSAYKYFIANTVYPNANIVFSGDTLADKFAFVSTPYGALNPTQLARLNDADLIIITPDINSADYQTPDWGQLNVPMLLHSAYLSADAIGTGWGWISGYYENSAAMPSHSAGVSDGMAGDKWYGHEQWSSDSFFTGMTGHFVAANPDGSGDIAANWFPLFNSAGYRMGGSINSDSWGQGTILFSGNGSTQYNDKSFIVRWAQGNRLGRSGTTAASRRFGFNMGANDNYDAINGFLSPLTGANANGLLALQHALQYLYSPVANGRRPIPNAGTNKTLYIIPPAVTVDLNVNDATYTDGNGDTAGTLAWTIKAVNPVLEGTETITAGAATLTPTFHFTSPGVFIATLRATNGTLDYVESTKTITVSTPTVPYIVSVSPPNGRVVPNLTGPVIVQFDHVIAYTAPLQLTVANGGSPVVFNGSSADNITFSFSCGALALSGTNTSISFSLDTSTVKDGIGGVLAFPTPTYTWALIYNVLGPRPIVICSNRTVASDTAYMALLTTLYGAGTPITVLKSGYTASPWTAATSATLQTASLVILDDNNSYNDAQWNALRAPLISNSSSFCKAANHMMAPNDNNWPSQTDIRAENYWNNPFFEGVSVREDNDCVIALANTQLMNLEYAAGTGLDSFDPNQVPYGMSLGYYRGGDFGRKNAMFWPKNTRFYSGSTQTAQGRRLYALSAGNGSNMWATNQLSPNGVQFAINLHKYFASPTGAPNVVWKDPAAKLVQKMTAVTIRFDRTVNAPTAANMLTIKDQSNATIGTYGPAVAAPGGDGMVWTFDTSAANMVGKPAQTLHFSVAMTGVVETESLYNIPFQGAAYTWDTAYDPLGYNQILFIGDRPNSTKEVPAYAAWLANNYGPNQSYRFMEPTAFGAAAWSTSTLKAINEAKLIVMLASGNGGYTDAGYMGHFINSAQWNTVTNNMLILASGGPLAPNWGCTTTQNNWGLASLSVANALPALFRGTTVSSNQVTLYTGDLATRRLNFGTAAAPTFNGINYGFVRPGDGTSYVWLHEWLAGTIYAQGGTAFPAGRRLFYAVDNEDADSLFTNNQLATDGLTIFKNAFYYYDPPAAPPTIVSVTPTNGTLYVTSPPTQVTVTFNTQVTGVGALTISGASAGAFTTADNVTFTWTPTVLPNVTGTANLVLDTSSVVETGSGLNQPAASPTYAWSFSFDQSQYQPKIALVSQLGEDHSQYVTFLTNDAYSTSLTAAAPYKRQAVVEDIPGKYYNMTAAGQTALENGFSLVVVMPFQDVTKLPGSRWNTVNLPFMMHNAQLPSNQNWQWGSTPNNFTGLAAAPWIGAGIGWVILPAGLSALDPLIQGTEISVDGAVPPWRYLKYWNSTPVLRSFEPRLGQGTTYGAWGFHTSLARWDAGQTMDSGTPAKTRRVFQSIGTTDAATNVVGFFDPTTGARDLGAKQVARNALRWLFSPDSQPFPVVVKSSSPPMNGTSGVLGPITVVFTKPVSGVLGTDLTWNASLSAITYVATAAIPAGAAPTDTWIFNGPWETDAALIGQYQPINITLNAMDTPTHSHIISVDGDGCPLTNWTWNYAWTPVPASVSDKLWTLYE